MKTFILTLALAACLPAASQAAEPSKEAENLYKTKCSACHAADGSGNTAVGKKLNIRDLRSAEVQKQSDAQLIEITAKGKNKMPAYEKQLKAEEIRALVAYIRELGKKR